MPQLFVGAWRLDATGKAATQMGASEETALALEQGKAEFILGNILGKGSRRWRNPFIGSGGGKYSCVESLT